MKAKSLAEPIVIKDLAHLKEMASDGEWDTGQGAGGEFAMALNGGARSSKSIKYYPSPLDGDGTGGEWDVYHSISDCWAEYGSDEEFIEEEPNIMEAIKNGAFAFLYPL